MTEATARREAKAARDTGHCGFCGARGDVGTKFPHERDCKLVCEHSGLKLKVKEN